MNNLLLLTELAETPEAVEETFNLVEWVGENPVFVNACLAILAIGVAAICFLAKRKRK